MAICFGVCCAKDVVMIVNSMINVDAFLITLHNEFEKRKGRAVYCVQFCIFAAANLRFAALDKTFCSLRRTLR